MKIVIKGRTYNIDAIDFIDKGNTSGNINIIDKQILISKDSMDIDHTILHELVHGFFYECGLYNQYEDEELTNWIAFHIPEIIKVYYKITTSDLYKELKS